MVQAFVYLLMCLIAAYVTVFVVGPVLLADGTAAEKAMTLAFAIAAYAALFWFVRWFRRFRRRKR